MAHLFPAFYHRQFCQHRPPSPPTLEDHSDCLPDCRYSFQQRRFRALANWPPCELCFERALENLSRTGDHLISLIAHSDASLRTWFEPPSNVAPPPRPNDPILRVRLIRYDDHFLGHGWISPRQKTLIEHCQHHIRLLVRTRGLPRSQSIKFRITRYRWILQYIINRAYGPRYALPLYDHPVTPAIDIAHIYVDERQLRRDARRRA